MGLGIIFLKIVNLVITFLVAITSVFLPRLSYYYQEDKKKFSALITIGLHLMIFISLPAFVGFLFLSEPIIYIAYGNDFIAASQILKIFAIMIPIKCIGDIICYQVMIASKRESTLMKSYFVVMIVNFGINILLIPCIGSKGAAIASIVSEVLAFICVLIPALRIVCVKINKRSVICDLISSIFLMFFLAYIRTSIQDNTVTVALGIICGFVIYIVTNLILKNPTLYYCYDILKKRGDKY